MRWTGLPDDMKNCTESDIQNVKKDKEKSKKMIGRVADYFDEQIGKTQLKITATFKDGSTCTKTVALKRAKGKNNFGGYDHILKATLLN
jgi:hypothetical protein